MFPDQYFPLDIGAFWLAVDGLPSHVIEGYLRALTHYWQHTHCEGLRDDNEFLRKLCRIDRELWKESPDSELGACAIIFDNERFFCLEADGKWHQRRARAHWQGKVAAYQSQQRRTAAATKERLRRHNERKQQGNDLT